MVHRAFGDIIFLFLLVKCRKAAGMVSNALSKVSQGATLSTGSTVYRSQGRWPGTQSPRSSEHWGEPRVLVRLLPERVIEGFWKVVLNKSSSVTCPAGSILTSISPAFNAIIGGQTHFWIFPDRSRNRRAQVDADGRWPVGP